MGDPPFAWRCRREGKRCLEKNYLIIESQRKTLHQWGHSTYGRDFPIIH
jgi:hypothetical protein